MNRIYEDCYITKRKLISMCIADTVKLLDEVPEKQYIEMIRNSWLLSLLKPQDKVYIGPLTIYSHGTTVTTPEEFKQQLRRSERIEPMTEVRHEQHLTHLDRVYKVYQNSVYLGTKDGAYCSVAIANDASFNVETVYNTNFMYVGNMLNDRATIVDVELQLNIYRAMLNTILSKTPPRDITKYVHAPAKTERQLDKYFVFLNYSSAQFFDEWIATRSKNSVIRKRYDSRHPRDPRVFVMDKWDAIKLLKYSITKIVRYRYSYGENYHPDTFVTYGDIDFTKRAFNTFMDLFKRPLHEYRHILRQLGSRDDTVVAIRDMADRSTESRGDVIRYIDWKRRGLKVEKVRISIEDRQFELTIKRVR